MLDHAIEVWAPKKHNPTAAYQALVRNETGLSGQTVLNTLNQNELQSVANAIGRMEGFKPGTVTCQEGSK